MNFPIIVLFVCLLPAFCVAASPEIAHVAAFVKSQFTVARALTDFVSYRQLPPISVHPKLGSLCFEDHPPLFVQTVRVRAASRALVSYSSMEALHHGGNFARTIIDSLKFPSDEFLVESDYPCADVWVFRSFPPRNFRGVLIFSDAEKNHQVSGFPFLPLYPWVVYLGNKLADSLPRQFARQFWMPFASSHFAQRRFPGEMPELLQPSSTRVPLVLKTGTVAYLAHNCVPQRDRAFARLCSVVQCEALGRCPERSRVSKDERYGQYYLDEAMEKFVPFKFALVFENAISDGYFTEKMVNAYLAGAVPIYWGDVESVSESFDPRSFIFVDDVEKDDWLEKVRRLASDDQAYEKMRNFAPVTNGRIFSWREEMAGHVLGKAIVQSVRELLDERDRLPVEQQLEIAASDSTLLATTEFPE